MPSIPDLNPTAQPGLRVYGGTRHADQFGSIDKDNDDFEVALGTTGQKHSLGGSLPADDTYTILWDSTANGNPASFLWGRVKGLGGSWYLEFRNAAAIVFELQIRTGEVFYIPSGSSASADAANPIDRIRARVLTGGTVTTLDGYLAV